MISCPMVRLVSQPEVEQKLSEADEAFDVMPKSSGDETDRRRRESCDIVPEEFFYVQ